MGPALRSTQGHIPSRIFSFSFPGFQLPTSQSAFLQHWDLKSWQLAPSSFAKLLQKSPRLILLSHLVCQPRSQQRWGHPLIHLFAWPFCLISSSAAASRGPWGQDAALVEAAPMQLAVPPLPRHALHSYSDRHIRPSLKHQKSGIWRAPHIHTAVHTHPTDGPPIPTEKSGPMRLHPQKPLSQGLFLQSLGWLTNCWFKTWTLDPEGRERPQKEKSHFRLADGRVNKPGNLYRACHG